MPVASVDILMITFNRPAYTRLSLERLLSACGRDTRVWVWHNGSDRETLEVVESFRRHPSLAECHHSQENKRLREPTNWFWEHSRGELVGKVDDDCLVPEGWTDTLRQAHLEVPEFGVLGCWPFPQEDYVPELAGQKTRTFVRGHQVMQNCWVGGSGYLMKRRCIEQLGPIAQKQSFTGYCVQLALRGWINGWYFPFLYQEHMDDPRSAHTHLKTQEDFQRLRPLTAGTFQIQDLQGWVDFIRADARALQSASTDPRQYTGWRSTLKKLRRRLTR